MSLQGQNLVLILINVKKTLKVQSQIIVLFGQLFVPENDYFIHIS